MIINQIDNIYKPIHFKHIFSMPGTDIRYAKYCYKKINPGVYKINERACDREHHDAQKEYFFSTQWSIYCKATFHIDLHAK